MRVRQDRGTSAALPWRIGPVASASARTQAPDTDRKLRRVSLQLWTMGLPEPGTAPFQAELAQVAGWDGITFVDSQNLVGDPFVAVALAARATDRLRFATGVTNAFTRHPAALATVAATVQEESGRSLRARDRPRRHRALPPRPPADAGDRVRRRGSATCRRTSPARRSTATAPRAGSGGSTGPGQPKVPLDIAASGPRMLELAGGIAEQVTLAVGADPDRVEWALGLARDAAAAAGRDPASISFGMYVNVGCHPDVDAARALIAGGVAAFAHFSAMPGSTGAGLDATPTARWSPRSVAGTTATTISTTPPSTPARCVPEFVDRFAIVGPPAVVVERLDALHALGVDRFVITGPSFRSDRDHARTAGALLTEEVLPAVRAGGSSP